VDAVENIAVFCVGNKLMLDDGIGPAVYEELVNGYSFEPQIDIEDLGCMSLSMIERVNELDYIIAVDALDGTGEAPGTVFEYDPYDAARHSGAMASLHDLKLIDLFDAAALMDYHAEGLCFGMQVQNSEPAEITIGLTKPVYDALPLLVDAVLAALVRRGVKITSLQSGEVVQVGYHHSLIAE
jgi:hydrogenase maturation protease